MNLKVVNHKDEAFKDLKEAKEALRTREPRSFILWGHEITLTGSGVLKLGKEEFQMATSGLRSMLKRLQIPHKFGTEILPTEDLVRDVNSLLTVSEKRFQILIRPDDNTVVGFTNEEFTSVPYSNLLDVIVPPEGAQLESIRVNDENMVINIIKDRDIEPVKGDISKIGSRVVTSNTGFGDLSINTLVFRLICSNGATVGKQFDGASFSLKGRSASDILSDGMMFINQAVQNVELIAAGLERMVQLPITEMSMYDIDKDHHRVIKTPAMEILPSKMRKIIGSKDQTDQLFKDIDETTSTYDVYNNITAIAQRFNLVRRVGIEQIGGSILSVAMKDIRQAA